VGFTGAPITVASKVLRTGFYVGLDICRIGASTSSPMGCGPWSGTTTWNKLAKLRGESPSTDNGTQSGHPLSWGGLVPLHHPVGWLFELTPATESFLGQKELRFFCRSARQPSQSNALWPFPCLLTFQIILCCCYISAVRITTTSQKMFL